MVDFGRFLLASTATGTHDDKRASRHSCIDRASCRRPTSALRYTLSCSVGICWRSSICSIGSLLFSSVPSLEVGSCLPCFLSLYSVAGILPEYTVADALCQRNSRSHMNRYIPKRAGEFVLVLVLMSFFSRSSFVPQTLVLELAT